MKRKVTRDLIDYNTYLVKIRIEEEEVTALSALSANPRQSLINILGVVMHDPSAVEYNSFKPTKIELYNENGKWIMVSTITEKIV